MDQQRHDYLVELAWRYAAIIGIIDYEVLGVTAEEIATDRAWRNLIKIDDGLPSFDDLEAISYMAEMSGMPLDECREVLLEVWPPPEESSEC